MSHESREWYILLALSSLGAVASLYIGAVGIGLLAIAVYLMAKFVIDLIKGKFSVDLLMGAAALITWYLGAYFEGFLIISLYSLSEIIEFVAEKRALRALTSLSDLIPDEVVVIRDELRSIRPEEVKIGDVLLVRRGEAVVVDGVLIDDVGAFDTSIMTGEQEPVTLVKGQKVLSGYINVGDPVKVKAVSSFRESSLRLLVTEAEEALKRKSRLLKFLERITPPYTVFLLGSYAVASLIIGPYHALPLILAGCPSAFILTSATMTAVSIARLARRGIVVRGGIALERASKVKAIILDKTGTVTTGKLKVSYVKTFNGFKADELLKLAGGAGKGSIHPVSVALSALSDLMPESVKEVVGMGVEAVVNGRLVKIGKEEFVGFKGFDCGDLIPVHVSVDGKPAGTVCLKEEVGDDVTRLINELKKFGHKVILASGDREEKVSAIAKELGISEYYSGIKPQDKAELVRRVRKAYGEVAVIGDGINDTVALAEADLGVAVGRLSLTAGFADAVLLPGLRAFLELLNEAVKYRRAIMTGFITAALIKVTAIYLGMIGVLPMAAVVALGDDGSTLISLAVAGAIISFAPTNPQSTNL